MIPRQLLADRVLHRQDANVDEKSTCGWMVSDLVRLSGKSEINDLPQILCGR
jgi:hypothetical protein